MSLISVIVPVYKVEKYLDRCVESIVNQTYRDLEIILIDDGSPDNCPEMCDVWAEKDSRVKVIHKKNGGAADARNKGLDIAIGDIISFVDSDDIIHCEYYSVMVKIMEDYNCDIVECAYTVNDDLPEKISVNVICELDNFDGMKEHFKDRYCSSLIWNKLYRNEIVGNVRFVPEKMIDDEFFTYRVIGNSDKTVIIDSVLYYYRQQSDSVMHRPYSLKRLAAVESKIEKYEYVKKRFPELSNTAKVLLAGSCIYNGQMSLKYLDGTDKKKAYAFLKNEYKKCKISSLDVKNKILKHRIWYYIANISFYLCCKMRNLLHIGF